MTNRRCEHPLYRMPPSMQQCLAWMAEGNVVTFHMEGAAAGWWSWPMKGERLTAYQSWHGQTPRALARRGWIDYEVREIGIKEYRITDAGREALAQYGKDET